MERELPSQEPQSNGSIGGSHTLTESPEAGGSGPAVGPVPRDSLKRRTIVGAIWSFGGYGIGNMLRLVGSLVLSRLLFPEALGIMAAVSAFLAGLYMLSDLGVTEAVVRHERGEEPDFLNTAWTASVLRGFALYGLAILLSWPMSKFYGESVLLFIFPVSSLVVVIRGFFSPDFVLAKRKLAIRKIVVMEICAQISALTTMIILALIFRSVWALVIGNIMASITNLVMSYYYLGNYRPRFQWEREAWKDLYSFGKWIFLSTALTFVSGHGDRMILGHLMGMAVLGVYGIARNLVVLFATLVDRLCSTILYPAFSEVYRESRARLKSVYYRTRLKLDAALLPIMGVAFALGDDAVRFLYDSRYHEAGWMFQVLVIGAVFVTIMNPCQTALVALGRSRVLFFRSLGRAIWIVCVVPLAWNYFGLRGLCFAVATTELPGMVVQWVAFSRLKLLDLRRELLGLVFFGLGVGAGALLELLLAAIGLLGS